MTRKDIKIRGLDKALENVSEEQRATLAAEIADELSAFDPDDPPGEPVLQVAAGTRRCPTCGGSLLELGRIQSPHGQTLSILECESCDTTFCEDPAPPLQ